MPYSLESGEIAGRDCLICSTGMGAARVEDAQGTPTQSHISPSIPVHDDVCAIFAGARRDSGADQLRRREPRCAPQQIQCVEGSTFGHATVAQLERQWLLGYEPCARLPGSSRMEKTAQNLVLTVCAIFTVICATFV